MPDNDAAVQYALYDPCVQCECDENRRGVVLLYSVREIETLLGFLAVLRQIPFFINIKRHCFFYNSLKVAPLPLLYMLICHCCSWCILRHASQQKHESEMWKAMDSAHRPEGCQWSVWCCRRRRCLAGSPGSSYRGRCSSPADSVSFP